MKEIKKDWQEEILNQLTKLQLDYYEHGSNGDTVAPNIDAKPILDSISELLKEQLKPIYELAPELEKEGLENFDGYFVHCDEITKLFEGEVYDNSPLELITKLQREYLELMQSIPDKLKEQSIWLSSR